MHFKKILKAVLVTALILVSAAGYFFFRYSDELLSTYYTKAAFRAASEQRSARAAYLYEEALRHDSANITARLEAANLDINMGNNIKAEQELLNCINEIPDNVDGYIALSAFYVSQNRLADAVNLLNSVKNDYARTKLGSLRPQTPKFSPEPSRYFRGVNISVSNLGENICCYAVNDSNISAENIWQKEMSIDSNTTIYAVNVSSDGLVSDICEAVYQVEDNTVAIQFKDSTLEKMVRSEIKRYTGYITISDLKNIRALTNKTEEGKKIGAEITTFSDLQYLKNLEELSLYNLGELPDLTSLSVLPDLKSLSLVNCGINDKNISALSASEGLAALDLSDNQISDLSGISNLPALSYLSVKNNFVADITPLLLMDKLVYLDISGNEISNINSIGILKGLKWLNISDCNLTDISAVKTLSSLSYLDISNNRVTDIEAVAGCISLETLIAGNNSIASLSPLSMLSRIAVIDVRNNKVVSLRPLETITSIRTINVSRNNISDLSPLINCRDLQSVFAEGNPIDKKSVSAFAGITLQVD